jgi:hypothetical protein
MPLTTTVFSLLSGMHVYAHLGCKGQPTLALGYHLKNATLARR